MNPHWEESEFLFCDLQAAARYIRQHNPAAAHSFLAAAYDTFEFLDRGPAKRLLNQAPLAERKRSSGR
jgi:hypothetical protein